jgi:hypothetical protein
MSLPEPTYGTYRPSRIRLVTIPDGATVSPAFDFGQDAALAIETAGTANYTIEALSGLGDTFIEVVTGLSATGNLISLDADELAKLYPFRTLRLKVDAAPIGDLDHAIHCKG